MFTFYKVSTQTIGETLKKTTTKKPILISFKSMRAKMIDTPLEYFKQIGIFEKL